MADDANVGACALLAGLKATAEAFSLSEVRVMAALLCLHPDQTPLLRQVKEMMVRQTRSLGEEAAARNFGVSTAALKVICRAEETKETQMETPTLPNQATDIRGGMGGLCMGFTRDKLA